MKKQADWQRQAVGYRPEQGQQHKPANRTQYAGYRPQKRRKLNPVRVTLAVVCLAVGITSAVLLIGYISDYVSSKSVSGEMKALYQQAKEQETPEISAPPTQAAAVTSATESADTEGSAQPESTPNPTVKPARTLQKTYAGNERFNTRAAIDALQKKNRDIIGWLYIDDVLDEAVVQRDNKYYLTHDYLGKKSGTGALFLEESCKLYPVPECLLLHGHNMKTGAMFGSLKKYKVKGVDFFRDHGYIKFETLYEDATYVVFSVAMIDIRPSESAFLNFVGNIRFPTDESFMRYVGRLKTLSLYDIDIAVEPSDRLLILSTCDGEDDNIRLLVAARLLRPDEDTGVLNDALRSVKLKRTY